MAHPSLSDALALTRDQARGAFRAAVRVARADGGLLEQPTEDLLAVLSSALGVSRDETAEVDLAASFSSEQTRRALVDALVIVACIDGRVNVAREKEVLAIAGELGVRSHWAELLPSLRRGRVFAVKRALASSSPDARRLFRRTWHEEGVVGILRAIVFVLGLHRDEALAARFLALAECPEGSFGRAVTEHFRARNLAFPGEKNGVPERMVHHDLLHVLCGYDTDAAGECELGAFYAAFCDGDAFTFFMTTLATFHLGLRVSPAVVVPTRGAFDPARAVAAFVRGRAMRADVMGAWNYWELMPLPLGEVRERLGVDVVG